jgi:iron complex outermembrane receptor protein
MKYFVPFALFFTQCALLCAQTKGIADSVFQIHEVTVSSNRIEYFSIGNKIRTIDSSLIGSYTTANLSQVLSSYSQVQINSYGLGLSNPSIRGTGSSHTAVLWNGFNLQDLLNGGVDCSLIPINFMDDIKVQYGGGSALFGSGAIGGVIHLNNILDFEKGLTSSISSGYGSYGNMIGGVNLGYSNNFYSGVVKSFYGEAQNDFKFKNTTEYGAPVQTLKNAGRKQYGLLAGNAFRLSKSSKLESFFWFQNNDKDIPPTMATFQNANKDNQRDKFYRATASWKTWHDNADFTLRSGFSDYFMFYDTSHFQSIQSSTEAEYNLKLNSNHLINTGIDYTYEKGISKSLTTEAQRNRIALFTSYRFTDNESKWKIALNLRDELINHTLTPLTFSLGFERPVSSLILIKGIISKNYRVPTFNDLHWIGSGNPNLKCESGFNQELGLALSQRIEKVNFRYEVTGFNNKVSNWILWVPINNNWSPENISQVWARGVENEMSFSFSVKKIFIKTVLSYSYTKSTKDNADFAGDPAANKQLIYVPLHKGLCTITMVYRGFTLYYGQSFSGNRYTETNNSRSVASYSLGNFSLAKNFTFRNQLLTLSFQVNNLWNSVYQVMEFYPMPPRNYQFNIVYKL